MVSYIKLYRSEATKELLKSPNLFMLFTVIAIRARRTGALNVHNLKLGEAVIGSQEEIGGMSRQEFRTALKKLNTMGLVTHKSTNKGTIATLCKNDIYDINIEINNHQSNHQLTNEQPSSNHQATTNKNDKKVNNNNYKNYGNKKNRTNYESSEEEANNSNGKDYSKGF